MNRILVALDGSARASLVLDAAVNLAKLTRAKLILYRAISVSPDLPRHVLLDPETRLEELLVLDARRDLKKLAEHVDPALVELIASSFATAWDGICRFAKDSSVDLIVIGSHGYGRLDRLLGTVAGKVVNHADRNVLVVRTAL